MEIEDKGNHYRDDSEHLSSKPSLIKKMNALLMLMIVQTGWGFIAFLFNACMIPFHLYVLKLTLGITMIITFVEWSADALYIVAGIIGIMTSQQIVSPIVYYLVYGLYLIWGFIVVVFHALWINPIQPNYISWVAGLIGFVAAVLCWTFFFFPYLIVMCIHGYRTSRKQNSIEDSFHNISSNA
mmetsp:Transcript_1326/g.1983  ORF Transcript_1326/g.1983 Transcript_1326/m.1983 type:complete len:183 (+) Transcript_1326:1106-1654(+)